jgi:outer membrane lipoprotein SlyB
VPLGPALLASSGLLGVDGDLGLLVADVAVAGAVAVGVLGLALGPGEAVVLLGVVGALAGAVGPPGEDAELLRGVFLGP